MLTQSRLKEVLSYDPETGVFVWVKRLSSRGNPGDSAGRTTHLGYVTIGVYGKVYMAHRLAWLYMTGAFPSLFIDHINGLKTDNRFSNLRDVSCAENTHNRHVSKNRTGYRGVNFCNGQDGKFRATLMAFGKSMHLGVFDTAEDAHKAYLEAKKVHHPSAPVANSPQPE